MQAAQVQVELDEEVIKHYLRQELDRHVNQTLLLVDLPKLSELTSISQRYLETEFLNDPRVKKFERRKNRKRWWIWDNNGEGVKYAILEIMDEW